MLKIFKNILLFFLGVLLFSANSYAACVVPKNLTVADLISDNEISSGNYIEECKFKVNIAPINCEYCEIDTFLKQEKGDVFCKVLKKCIQRAGDNCLQYEQKLSETGCGAFLFYNLPILKKNRCVSVNAESVDKTKAIAAINSLTTIENKEKQLVINSINSATLKKVCEPPASDGTCETKARQTGKCYRPYEPGGVSGNASGKVIGCVLCDDEKSKSTLPFQEPVVQSIPAATHSGSFASSSTSKVKFQSTATSSSAPVQIKSPTAYWLGDCSGKGIFNDNPSDIFPSRTGCYNPEERFVKYYADSYSNGKYSRSAKASSNLVPREDVLNLDKECATASLSTLGTAVIYNRTKSTNDNNVIQCLRPKVADKIDEEENFLTPYMSDTKSYYTTDIVLEKKPNSDESCKRVIKKEQLISPYQKECEYDFKDDFYFYPPFRGNELTSYVLKERYLPPSLINDKDERILGTPYSRRLKGNELGEYGYGSTSIERTDYPFNKYDVYNSGGASKSYASNAECLGTKMRRQAALKLFLEEYAYQTDCNGDRGVNLTDESIFNKNYCQTFVRQNQADDLGDLGLTQVVFGRFSSIKPAQVGLRSEAFDMLNFASKSELFVMPSSGFGFSQDICKKKVSSGGLGTFTDGNYVDFKRRGCPESYPIGTANWPEFFSMESCNFRKGASLINNPIHATVTGIKLTYKIISTTTSILDIGGTIAGGGLTGPGGLLTALGATTGNALLDNFLAGFVIDLISGQDPLDSLFNNLIGNGKLIDLSGLPFIANVLIDAGIEGLKTGNFNIDFISLFAAGINDLGGIEGLLNNSGLGDIAEGVNGFFDGINNFFSGIDDSITKVLFGEGGLVNCDGAAGIGGMFCGLAQGIVGAVKDFVVNIAVSQVQGVLNNITGGFFGELISNYNSAVNTFNQIQSERVSQITSKCGSGSKNTSCRVILDSLGGVKADGNSVKSPFAVDQPYNDGGLAGYIKAFSKNLSANLSNVVPDNVEIFTDIQQVPVLVPMVEETSAINLPSALKGMTEGLANLAKEANGIIDGLISQVMAQAGSLLLTTKINDYRSMLWPPMMGVGVMGQALLGIPVVIVSPEKINNVEKTGWVDTSWSASSCTMMPLMNNDGKFGDYFGVTPDYSPFRDCIGQGCEVKGFTWKNGGGTWGDFKLNWLIAQEAMWCEFELPLDPFSASGPQRLYERHNPFTINKKRGSSPLMLGTNDTNYKLPGYVQVERIRDTCGAFSQRGSWVYDTKTELGKWLIGEDKARCADWVGPWGVKYNQDKLSSWRLERFDYEFLKTFIECTGPVKDKGPNPCDGSFRPWQAIYNSCLICCKVPGRCNFADPSFVARLGACTASAAATSALASASLAAGTASCINPLIICPESCPLADNRTKPKKDFWKKEVDGKKVEGGGFWCKCRSDLPSTTLCREDTCTCQQPDWPDLIGNDWNSSYAKFPSNMGFAIFNAVFSAAGQDLCDNYGPYRRWLQCYHLARSRACPVLTRDISMSTPGESLLFPPFKQSDSEKEERKKQFCDGSEVPQPPELNVRWQLEEPNFLARLNVADDPGGYTKQRITYDDEGNEKVEEGNFYAKNSDLVFLSQVKDESAPYLEPAVPSDIPFKEEVSGSNDNATLKAQDAAAKLDLSRAATSKNFTYSGLSKISSDGNLNPNPRALEAITGPRGCDIGGWYEMMLYQARCIQNFGLGCICDYDKTFIKGSAEKYVTTRAGAEFTYIIDNNDDNVPRAEDKIFMPLMWRGNAGPDFASASNTASKLWDKAGKTTLKKDSSGNYSRKEPVTYRDTDYDGIFGIGDNGAKAGDILIWDESIIDVSTGEDARYRRHVAYVEERGFTKSPMQADAVNAPLYEYIKVSEMNWGKYQDSCGNTDRWGVPTTRMILKDPIVEAYKNACTNPREEDTGTDASFACFELYKMPCDNPDNAVCYEHNHKKVKIYRPSLDVGSSSKTAFQQCAKAPNPTKEVSRGIFAYGEKEIVDYVNKNVGSCDPNIVDRTRNEATDPSFIANRAISNPLFEHCAGKDASGIGCPKYKSLDTAVIATYNWILPSIPFSLNGNIFDMLKNACQFLGLQKECGILDCATSAALGKDGDKNRFSACEQLCDSSPNMPVVKEACSAFSCYKSAQSCASGSTCNLDVQKCCSLPGLIDIPQCCDYLNIFGSFLECVKKPSAQCCELYPSASTTCKSLLGCVGLDNYEPTPSTTPTSTPNKDVKKDSITDPLANYVNELASVAKLSAVSTPPINYLPNPTNTTNTPTPTTSSSGITLEPSKCCQLFPGEIACAAWECFQKPDLSCCNKIISASSEVGFQLPSQLSGLLSQCQKISQCITSFNAVETQNSNSSPPLNPPGSIGFAAVLNPTPPNNFPPDIIDVPPSSSNDNKPKSSKVRNIANSCCGTVNGLGIDNSRLCSLANCYADYETSGKITSTCCEAAPEIPECASLLACAANPNITCCDALASKIKPLSSLGTSCSQVRSCINSVNGGKFVDASCCNQLPSNLRSAAKCDLLLQCQIEIRRCEQNGTKANCKSCCDRLVQEFGSSTYVPECSDSGTSINIGINIRIADILQISKADIGSLNPPNLRTLADLQRVIFDVFQNELDKLLSQFGGLGFGEEGSKAPCTTP